MNPNEPTNGPALPTTVTTSGRVVYDPSRAPRPELDPQAAASIRDAFDQAAALDAADAREAPPVPIELSPGSGGLLRSEEAQDAARVHVEVSVPRGAAPARVDSAPVKIADSRRAKTVRVASGPRREEGEKGAEGEADAGEASVRGGDARAGAPGATTQRRAVWIVVGAIVLALVLWLAMRGGGQVDGGAAPSAGETTSAQGAAEPASSAAAATSEASPSTASPSAAAPAESASESAPSPAEPNAPSAPAAQASGSTASVKVAPQGAGDPYGDAGSPSMQPAASATAASAPAAAPSASVTGPAAAPSSSIPAPPASAAPSTKPASGAVSTTFLFPKDK